MILYSLHILSLAEVDSALDALDVYVLEVLVYVGGAVTGVLVLVSI